MSGLAAESFRVGKTGLDVFRVGKTGLDVLESLQLVGE
jgi:hypothetical protein